MVYLEKNITEDSSKNVNQEKITLKDLELESDSTLEFGPGNIGPRRDIGPC